MNSFSVLALPNASISNSRVGATGRLDGRERCVDCGLRRGLVAGQLVVDQCGVLVGRDAVAGAGVRTRQVLYAFGACAGVA